MNQLNLSQMTNEGSNYLVESFHDENDEFSVLFGTNNAGLDMEFDSYLFELEPIRELKNIKEPVVFTKNWKKLFSSENVHNETIKGNKEENNTYFSNQQLQEILGKFQKYRFKEKEVEKIFKRCKNIFSDFFNFKQAKYEELNSNLYFNGPDENMVKSNEYHGQTSNFVSHGEGYWCPYFLCDIFFYAGKYFGIVKFPREVGIVYKNNDTQMVYKLLFNVDVSFLERYSIRNLMLPPYITINNPDLKSALEQLGQNIKKELFGSDNKYVEPKNKFRYVYNKNMRENSNKKQVINSLMRAYNENVSRRLISIESFMNILIELTNMNKIFIVKGVFDEKVLKNFICIFLSQNRNPIDTAQINKIFKNIVDIDKVKTMFGIKGTQKDIFKYGFRLEQMVQAIVERTKDKYKKYIPENSLAHNPTTDALYHLIVLSFLAYRLSPEYSGQKISQQKIRQIKKYLHI